MMQIVGDPICDTFMESTRVDYEVDVLEFETRDFEAISDASDWKKSPRGFYSKESLFFACSNDFSIANDSSAWVMLINRGATVDS